MHMRQQGKAREVKGDTAIVGFTRSEACEGCNACRLSGKDDMLVSIKNTLGAQKGDIIEVELEAKRLLSAGAWAYLFPLLMIFAGLAIGHFTAAALGLDKDMFAAICSLLMLGVAFIALRLMNRRFASQAGYSPVMCGIITIDE